MTDVFTVLAQDHQEVKAMLAELERGPTKATGATEDQLALRKKMTEQLIIEESRHEALEEMYFWPAVRAETSAELGTKIAGGKTSAPTRPHPHTPPSPGVLKTAGPAVAAADKARDAVTGRGN